MSSSTVRQIIEEANLRLQNDPTSLEPARSVFSNGVSKIEQSLLSAGESEKKRGINDLVELLLARARWESDNGQKKQSDTIYRESIANELCREDIRLWMDYSKFMLSMKKEEKASKIIEEGYSVVMGIDKDSLEKYWLDTQKKLGKSQEELDRIRKDIFKKDTLAEESSTNTSLNSSKLFQDILDQVDLSPQPSSSSAHLELLKRFVPKRDHRPMALFQEPLVDLNRLTAAESAPRLPNHLLYYLATVLVDDKCFEIVQALRFMQKQVLDDLDQSQQKAYAMTVADGKDIHMDELKRRIEKRMKSIYDAESKRVLQLREDQQRILQDSGIPGFMLTSERPHIRIQRHLVQLIQYMDQKRNAEKSTNGNE